jgi:glycerol uptake facilitator-like aquaporin
MIKFLANFFKNNGHLRGALYFTAAALGGITGAFTHWAEVPPRNWYEIIAEFLGAFAAGIIAVRAYLDTHLSRTNNENPPKVTGAGESAS